MELINARRATRLDVPQSMYSLVDSALKTIEDTSFEDLSDEGFEELVSSLSAASNGDYFVVRAYGEWGRGIDILVPADGTLKSFQ